MANVLQTKMMTINELMVTLHGEDLEKPIDHPEYLSLVREKKDWDGATKEELLSHVQVIHSVEIIDIYCCWVLKFFRETDEILNFFRKPQDLPVPYTHQWSTFPNLQPPHPYLGELKLSVVLTKT